MGKKLSIEEVEKLLETKGLKIYEGEVYKDVDSRLKCIDEEGYIITIILYNIRTGQNISRFHVGNSHSLQNVQHYLDLNNIPLKLAEGQKYIGANNKLKFIDEEGYVVFASLGNLRVGKTPCRYE